MTNQEVVQLAIKKLQENDEWIERFAQYAQALEKREKMYKSNRLLFRTKWPLSGYTSVSMAKKAGYEYDLRFKGQSIGVVRFNRQKELVFIKGAAYKNFKGLPSGVKFPEIVDKEILWRKGEDPSKKHAGTYRSFLKKYEKDLSPVFPEHVRENLLLHEFKCSSSAYKSLIGIKPVELCGSFFQMPTPLMASNHAVGIQYAKNGMGGGIDILSRVRHCGNRLCVMEVKDDYTNDTQEQALQQALAYATFLALLLRSKNGEKWWKIFGFHGNVPKQLHIDVASLTPLKDIDEQKDEAISLPNNCTLHLYSLYFNDKALLAREKFEFKGTYVTALQS